MPLRDAGFVVGDEFAHGAKSNCRQHTIVEKSEHPVGIIHRRLHRRRQVEIVVGGDGHPDINAHAYARNPPSGKPTAQRPHQGHAQHQCHNKPRAGEGGIEEKVAQKYDKSLAQTPIVENEITLHHHITLHHQPKSIEPRHAFQIALELGSIGRFAKKEKRTHHKKRGHCHARKQTDKQRIVVALKGAGMDGNHQERRHHLQQVDGMVGALIERG